MKDEIEEIKRGCVFGLVITKCSQEIYKNNRHDIRLIPSPRNSAPVAASQPAIKTTHPPLCMIYFASSSPLAKRNIERNPAKPPNRSKLFPLAPV